MIARTCLGVTLASNADRYLEYLNEALLPAYRTAEGNKATFVLIERQEGLVYFVLLSFWVSRDALVRFAGPDIETAIQDPEEKSLLVAYESIARHYEVVYAETNITAQCRPIGLIMVEQKKACCASPITTK